MESCFIVKDWAELYGCRNRLFYSRSVLFGPDPTVPGKTNNAGVVSSCYLLLCMQNYFKYSYKARGGKTENSTASLNDLKTWLPRDCFDEGSL